MFVKHVGCYVCKLIAFVSDVETHPALNKVAKSKLSPRGRNAFASRVAATQNVTRVTLGESRFALILMLTLA